MFNFLYYYNIGYYIVLGIVALISFAAQSYVQSNYNKYRSIATTSNLTGAQVAKRILDSNGITNVSVVESSGGVLSDHYDPQKKVVALSSEVYHNNSIASMAVAAHEVGHAIQYHTGYKAISLRNLFLKPAIIASKFSQIAIVIGLIGSGGSLAILFDIGLILIGVIAVFQIITLPVEFDASRRALKIIKSDGYADYSEYDGAKSMLTAAALTYVAAVLGTLMNLLYYISLRRRRD